MNKQKRKGMTLIEVIIALSLVAMIITLAGSMMIFSTNSQAAVNKEFQIQADMRIATEILNQQIRYSSAVFMLNENQFQDNNDLKNGWNYVALNDEKNEIIHYIWNKSSGTHREEVLVRAHDRMHYGLNFNDATDNSRMVNFQLDGYVQGSNSLKLSISTILNALNSAVVDDSGTPISPSVTLSYRLDDIPDSEKIKVAVTMVLDKSGSMGYVMGGNGPGKSDIRISVMKEKAKYLIDLFADMDNVYVSMIPFSTNANNPGDFLKATENKTSLKNDIDSLNANGGTNAGDGLRRSYYKHRDFNKNEVDKVLNYTILLMDGDPTFWPSEDGNTHFYGEGNISNSTSYMGGNGSSTISGSMNYIKSFNDLYVKKNNSSQTVFMKTFVIGFTGVSEEVSRAKDIASYHSHSTDDRIKGIYYAATSSQELEEVFTSIADNILKETWHIYGPLQ